MNNGSRDRGQPSMPGDGPTSASATRRASTKELLIETGERLFGQHGFEGISLREIAAAAGQSNSNVVQYHFKDKSGLVRAILEERVQYLEALRSEMLAGLQENGRHQARDLLGVLWRPSMTFRAVDGSHTFCRFLLQYMIQPHIAQHPLARLYDVQTKSAVRGKDLSCLVKATRLLRSLYAKLPEPVLNQRLSALSMMFLATVVEHDNAKAQRKDGAPTEFNIEPILDMSIAALSAPS